LRVLNHQNDETTLNVEIPEDNEHSVDYYESQAQELSRLVEEPQIAPLPNMGP
jgi:hypothetical protein